MTRFSPLRATRARLRLLARRAAGTDALVQQAAAALAELAQWRRGRQLAATAAAHDMSLTRSNDPRCTVLDRWEPAAPTPYVVVRFGDAQLHPEWLPLACTVLDLNPDLVGVFGEHLDHRDDTLVWSFAPELGLDSDAAGLLAVSALVFRSTVLPGAAPVTPADAVRAVAWSGSLRSLPVPASRG